MRRHILPLPVHLNDEWWTHQVKGQRAGMRALLIAVGEVNKDRSPYASKHATAYVQRRRKAKSGIS